MSPIDSIKSAAGLYKPDRYIPIVAAIVNLILSVILVKYLGLSGIFIGTIVSTLLFSFWIKPMLVYKYIFKKNLLEYFIDIFLKLFAVMICGLVCWVIGEVVFESYTVLNLIGRLLVCLIIPNIVMILSTFKTEEFRYIYNTSIPIITRIKYFIVNKLKIQNN